MWPDSHVRVKRKPASCFSTTPGELFKFGSIRENHPLSATPGALFMGREVDFTEVVGAETRRMAVGKGDVDLVAMTISGAGLGV